jgi:hypothetical protein
MSNQAIHSGTITPIVAEFFAFITGMPRHLDGLDLRETLDRPLNPKRRAGKQLAGNVTKDSPSPAALGGQP